MTPTQHTYHTLYSRQTQRPVARVYGCAFFCTFTNARGSPGSRHHAKTEYVFSTYKIQKQTETPPQVKLFWMDFVDTVNIRKREMVYLLKGQR